MEINLTYAVDNPATLTSPEVKIPLEAKNFIKLYNGIPDNIVKLIDGNTATKPDTDWSVFVSTPILTYEFAGLKNVVISKLRVYDVEGSIPAEEQPKIYAVDEYYQITLLATLTGSGYMQWDETTLTTPVKAKYLWVVYGDNLASEYFAEFEVYGNYDVDEDYPKFQVTRKPLINNFVGTNIYEWSVLDPNAPDSIRSDGGPACIKYNLLRHYCDWTRLEEEKGMYRFSPEWSGGWELDVMYEYLHDNGVLIHTCFQGVPDWISGTFPEPNTDNVPVEYPDRFDDPKSYLAQAKMAFQFAARYGRTSVDPSLVNIDTRQPEFPWIPPNVVKIGLGYVSVLECGNETNRFWKGRNCYQTAREHAANLSAFYDGHKGLLGNDVGVKQADPTMLVSTQGAVSVGYDYFKGVIDWCKQYRGYKPDGTVDVPFDIIQYHRYNNDDNSMQHGGATTGVCPEGSGLYEDVSRLKELLEANCPQVMLMCGETGYDWNQGSVQRAVPIAPKDVYQVIADWEFRTILETARAGVDMLTFYEITDNDPTGASTTQYMTSGQVNNDYSPRPVMNILSQIKLVLDGFEFDEQLNDNPRVQRWKKGSEAEAYILWMPTQNNSTDTYLLDNLPSHTSATLVDFDYSTIEPDTETLSVNTSYSVDVSEKPVILLIEL